MERYRGAIQSFSESDQPGGRDKIGTGSMIGKFARKLLLQGQIIKQLLSEREMYVKVKLKTELTREYFVLRWRSADLGLLIALRKPGPGGCCWGQAGIWKLEPGHRAPGAASGRSRGENGEMDGERERPLLEN